MSLEESIKTQIRANGPLSIADYMQICLLDPRQGYYTTQTPFGGKGDFVTAPEISQMFGELIGLSLAQCWLDQGAPSRFTLAELGPGNGTLMADILRATKGVVGFHAAAEITLLEASPALRDKQATTLAPYNPAWIDQIDALKGQPLYLVANEFFDALPVQQYCRDGTGWRERQVGLIDDALAFGLGPRSIISGLKDRLEDTKDGDIVELRPAATPIMLSLSQKIAAHGGGALIIDYGDWRSLGDTLQAVKNHTAVDPLTHPGSADLTTHVDFEALINDCQCTHSRVTPQGVFLERLGITNRAQALAQNMQQDALKTHIAAHRRLTHPSEMGNLFKVLGLVPNEAAMLSGLER